jgi:IS1 family transposase
MVAHETKTDTTNPNEQGILRRRWTRTRRATEVARKTARMHGTPIYIWKNCKVVAEKP